MAISAVRRLVLTLAGAIMLALAAGAAPARADCAKGEAQCPSNLGGACAPMGSVCCPNNKYSVIGAACSGEQQGDWGAIAVVIWHESSGAAHVGFGMGLNEKTLSQASKVALLDCQKESNELCYIAADFSNGACGYVSIGAGTNDVRWAISANADDALKDCSKNGDACVKPVGGCTNKP